MMRVLVKEGRKEPTRGYPLIGHDGEVVAVASEDEARGLRALQVYHVPSPGFGFLAEPDPDGPPQLSVTRRDFYAKWFKAEIGVLQVYVEDGTPADVARAAVEKMAESAPGRFAPAQRVL